MSNDDWYIPMRWVSDDDSYFLRDDRDAEICDEERYSLFRETPNYSRILVLGGNLGWAIKESFVAIKRDRDNDYQD